MKSRIERKIVGAKRRLKELREILTWTAIKRISVREDIRKAERELGFLENEKRVNEIIKLNSKKEKQ